MPKEIELIEPEMSPEASHIPWHDIIRYSEIVGKVVMALNAMDTMAAGSSMNLDPIKMRRGTGEFELALGPLKRTK